MAIAISSVAFPPAGALTFFPDLDLNAMAGCQHLLRADIWFSETMLHEGNQKLFQAARKMGLAVSIDLNWDPHWGRASAEEIRSRKAAVRAVLPWVNLVHGNVRELNEFAETTDLDTALKSLIGWGAEAVVVHLGERRRRVLFRRRSLMVRPPAPGAKSRMNLVGTGDVLSVCMMLLHHQTEAAHRRAFAIGQPDRGAIHRRSPAVHPAIGGLNHALWHQHIFVRRAIHKREHASFSALQAMGFRLRGRSPLKNWHMSIQLSPVKDRTARSTRPGLRLGHAVPGARQGFAQHDAATAGWRPTHRTSHRPHAADGMREFDRRGVFHRRPGGRRAARGISSSMEDHLSET